MPEPGPLPPCRRWLDQTAPLLAHRQFLPPQCHRSTPPKASPRPIANPKPPLIDEVSARTGKSPLKPDIFTVGFARRVATYKRADLLFHDPHRLAEIAQRHGGLQILYAGKSHPADEGGKQIIRTIYQAAHKLNSADIRILYLENYDWELGALLTAGVDLWLNTPRRPYEASGTSGMKAALNGVPSLSTMDGWWIEGCVENVTGWCIAESDDDAAEAASLYEQLDQTILPLYHQPEKWRLRSCAPPSPSTAASSTPTACLANTPWTPTSPPPASASNPPTPSTPDHALTPSSLLLEQLLSSRPKSRRTCRSGVGPAPVYSDHATSNKCGNRVRPTDGPRRHLPHHPLPYKPPSTPPIQPTQVGFPVISQVADTRRQQTSPPSSCKANNRCKNP